MKRDIEQRFSFQDERQNSLSIQRCGPGGMCAALALLIFADMPTARAFEFSSGELTGNFDSTFSVGFSSRVEDRDPDLVGIANGGNGFSVNGDDGNLNYDEGLFSSALKGTHDLELDYRNFGAFFRGTYFYDYENEEDDRERTPLSDDAQDLVGSDARVLDAYLRGSFNPGDKPLDLRVGKQVVSWGESTFIQNSINTINPVDVSKLRVAGAELREALEPVGMVWADLGVSTNISIEAFYQIDWEETKIDPPGTYFSTNDFAGESGRFVVTGFGSVSDTACPAGDPRCVPRAANRDPDDEGQFGLALRWYAPAIDTELGFFYINYHSRLPIISANAVTVIAPGPTPVPSSASYFIEYPEDIQLFGVSFNTDIGTTGIALQGELSYRQDVPLQIDDLELLLSALCSPASQLGPAGQSIVDCLSGSGSEVSGFRQLDVVQLQATATKAFGPSFGANQWVLLGEAGVTHVRDMPSKDQLRFEGPGTSLPGDPLVAASFGVPVQANGFADATSWGYRLLTRFDFNNAIGAFTLSPRLAFAHDVNGTSPGPGGNFIEDRKALTLGLGSDYQNTFSLDLSYTRFYGAGNFNLIHDRDFISLVAKYSF